MKNAGVTVLFFLTIIAAIVLIYQGVNDPKTKQRNAITDNPDLACQTFYGKDYQFINGNRAPSLCVTKDGKIRYFDVILNSVK